MNDLSHEARELLAVARKVVVATEARRQRIRHSVLLRVAAVTAASTGAGVAGATSLATKVVVTAVLASVVTGGVYGVSWWRTSAEVPSLRRGEHARAARHQRRPPGAPAAGEPPRPLAAEVRTPQSPLGLGLPSGPEPQLAPRPTSLASAPPRARAPEPPATGRLPAAPSPVVAPRDDQPPLAAAPTAPLLPAWPTPGQGERGAPRSEPLSGLGRPAGPMAPPPAREAIGVPSPGGRALPAPSPGGTLLREVALLQRAHEALRDGKPQLALRVLGDYDHEFPHGALREERTAIAVIADCQAQPGSLSRARAQEFLRTAPGTLLADGVRAACRPPDRGQP